MKAKLKPAGDGKKTPARETVSVILASYTVARWDALQAAVASVRVQTHPAHEIIVVIDGDTELERLARKKLDGVVVAMNAHPSGLSGSRQTGAERASGTILAFLDDDAIADPDWIAELLVAYEDPGAIGVGGHVDPLWQEPAPAWFPPEFNWVIGCTYAGMPIKVTRIRNPIGANMSVWASVLAEAGAFDSRLGRVDGRQGLSGTAEETEFGIRTTATHPGRYWVYRPQARVRHAVTPDRATWRYFIARCRVEGRAKGLLATVAGAGPGLESERIYVRSVLPRAVARNVRAGLAGERDAFARAGAILAGLAVTTLAYVISRGETIRAARRS